MPGLRTGMVASPDVVRAVDAMNALVNLALLVLVKMLQTPVCR